MKYWIIQSGKKTIFVRCRRKKTAKAFGITKFGRGNARCRKATETEINSYTKPVEVLV